MQPISRRRLLRAAGAGALGLPLTARVLDATPAHATTPAAAPAPGPAPGPAAATGAPAAAAAAPHRWFGAGPFTQVCEASAPGRRRYFNDHSLIRATDGDWHLFSIVGDSAEPGRAPDSATEIHFAHASAPTLQGPWTPHLDALTVDAAYGAGQGGGEEHLWAPHVIASGGRYWMFYAAGGPAGKAAINLATSTDLFTWTRHPGGPLFRGIAARDPMVLRIGAEWVMYYTDETADGRHVVAYRRTTDLTDWRSDPGIAYADPSNRAEGVSVTESPFVLERDGWYHLFVGPRGGYEGTDVLASRDPFRFTLDGWAGHVPGHASEVVTDGEQTWVSAAGWFREGLALAPLAMRDIPPFWQSPDNPVAAVDVLGRLTVFALAAGDRSMLVRTQTDPGTDTWGDWQPFGGPAGAVPTLGRNADGRLELFSLAPDGAALHHRVQRQDGGWGEWEWFGSEAGSAPAVVRNADGRLEVFALGPAGTRLARRRQTAPGAATWEPWEGDFGLGPVGAPPVVGVNADGRLEAFALAPGGAELRHRWQATPGGAWSAWTRFGTAAGAAPRIGRDGTGRLDVSAVAPSGTGAFHRRQSAPSGGWDGWEPLLDWSTAAPLLVPSADGRLEAFTLSPGGERLGHRWQATPGGAWSPTGTFGEDFGEPGVRYAGPPSATADATGRIHLFAVTAEGRIRTRFQVRPSAGWQPWAAFGDVAVAPLRAGAVTY
ncbi:glycosyl hydrolase family 32 [Streptomyces sp. NPDC090025]|uniref:glycosyl hydrolase family 32 n=1 Tax=Streptomyces sp. NPDC090025 TaxID=3365922 RepID=UPI003837A20B